MKAKCNVIEIFTLYVFSAYYVIKEFICRLFSMKHRLNGKVFMKCDGRTALITGGTSGIGLETARRLLSFGMNVIIGSKTSAEESEDIVHELRTQFPRCKVEVWYVDLSSMNSVKAFADRFLTSGLPLHILINNAAIMFAPFSKTDDGFESHFAINYLSHCLLTKLLLLRLKESGTSKCYSRIVNVTSCLHYLAEEDLKSLNNMVSYCPHQSYMQSKLFQMMFTISLNKFLKGSDCPIVVNGVHPGVIYTGLYKYVWWTPLMQYLTPLIFKTPVNGADVCVYAALSVKLEKVGGKYIEDCQFVIPSNSAQNNELQTRLWNETWKLLSPWLDENENENVD